MIQQAYLCLTSLLKTLASLGLLLASLILSSAKQRNYQHLRENNRDTKIIFANLLAKQIFHGQSLKERLQLCHFSHPSTIHLQSVE